MIKELFRVRSAAIVGASRNTGKPGHVILKNFLRDFKGRIYPVNPNADRIEGLKSYPSISSIPYDVDLAVISVNETALPNVLKEAISKGVKFLVIITDIKNPDIKEKVLNILTNAESRVLGPSSIGLYIPKQGINTLFNPGERQGYPGYGGVGIATQSGAVGTLILDGLYNLGIGVSKFIGLGREWDITLEEIIKFFEYDEDTLLLTIYIENILNGRRFFEVVKEFTYKKPLIIYKGGREEPSRYAVLSHTGVMTDYKIFYGVAKQAGSILIRDIGWIVDAIQAIYFQPIPKGSNIGIVTGAGGIGIALLDEVEGYGLSIARYVDVGGTSGDDEYIDYIEEMYRDSNIDVIALIPYYPSPAITHEFNIKISSVVKYMLEKGYTKPLYVIQVGGGYRDSMSLELIKNRIPILSSTSSFVEIIGELYNYWRYLRYKGVDKRYKEVYEAIH